MKGQALRTISDFRAALVGLVMCVAGLGWASAVEASVPPPPVPHLVQRGEASWYGKAFHGRRTASGEIYDMYALTAAHPELPLGSTVLVKNLNNGRSVRVRVNDRGPAVEDRIIDLSYAAARKLDAIDDGIIPVEMRVLTRARE